MKAFTIRQIIEATKGQLLESSSIDLDGEVNGVSTDTRTIKKGELFIPLVGEIFDGHYFVDEAIEKGASAVLIHREDAKFLPELFPEVAVIKVADTLKALQDLAAFQRSRFNIPIVAVTGSNGKTTTKDMIALVLSQKYKVLKTQGNFNNEIGLPLTLLGLDDSHEVAVVEMGMNHLGEIHRLAKIARPNIGVITNIGVSHIQNLGTRENILKAKMEIFDFFTSEDKAILNGDDEFLSKVAEEFPYQVKYYGISDIASVKAQDIRLLGEKGISYNINIGSQIHPIEIPIPGKHNVYNSLAAVAVGSLMGIDIQDIANALKSYRSGDMRLNIFTTDSNIKVIDDVYNASPDSMKAAIEVLKDLGEGRKVAILGDMLELGDYSQKGHSEVGEVVAHKGIDILITVGQESKFIGIEARKCGMDDQRIIHLESNKDVIDYLDTIIEQGDKILVKGSRSMKMEEIVEYLRSWGNRQ